MRLGLTETVLILLIALVAVGPSVYNYVNRWLRRAQRTAEVSARRRAEAEAARRAEVDAAMLRLSRAGTIAILLAFAAGIYGLVLRPIDVEPQSYAAPPSPAADEARAVTGTAAGIELAGYGTPSCIAERDGWLYLAAPVSGHGGGSALIRVRPDGSGLAQIIAISGEITAFCFDGEGNIWYTSFTAGSGALCRLAADEWGAAAAQIVTQIDGRALACPGAVAAAPDGKIYFTEVALPAGCETLEDAERTELIAHTTSGQVLVYDPAARSVEQVLGGRAGAAGRAISADGQSLYAAELANRRVLAVAAAGRGLAADGSGCEVFTEGLAGYPCALATDEDGNLYIAYRWGLSSWLENHADSTFLRGVAMRLPHRMQTKLFGIKDAPAAAGYSADGAALAAFYAGSGAQAVCPAAPRLYLGTDDGLCWLGY